MTPKNPVGKRGVALIPPHEGVGIPVPFNKTTGFYPVESLFESGEAYLTLQVRIDSA